MKKILLQLIVPTIIIFLSSLTLAWSQQKQITGRVYNSETDEGVPEVSVSEVGTSNITVTDADGRYSITVGGPNTRLSFSSNEYSSREVQIGSQNVLDVRLEPVVTVVTGYSNRNRNDLNAGVGVIKTRTLTALPLGNVINDLQGRLSGVTVTGTGTPGATAKIRIRGISSFGNNDPLFLINGVPSYGISALNPNDVESVSILKDAAASIYGSRSLNGVVVITTRKGSGGIKVNYSMYTGFQDPGKSPDLLDAKGYADLQWLVYKNDGINETHPIYGPSSNPVPTLPSWAGDTDWYKAVTNPASITNHDLSLSGGNTHAQYLASLNYFKQEGIVLNTFTTRFSARFNSEYRIDDRITIGENLQITHQSGQGVTGFDDNSAIGGIYRLQTVIPVVMNQSVNGLSHNFVPGEWGGTGLAPRLGTEKNLVAMQTRDGNDSNFDVRMLGNLYIEVRIIKDLKFRSSFGGTFQNGYYSDYTPATYENAENIMVSSLKEGAFYNHDWVWTNTVSMNKEFGAHQVHALVGAESIKSGVGRSVFGAAAGYFSDAASFRTLSNGAAIISANSYLITPKMLYSSFITADYIYNNKYLLSGSLRKDSDSAFGADKEYGSFPSFSLGWRISKESFFTENNFITDLKIRVAFGALGNQFYYPIILGTQRKPFIQTNAGILKR